MDAIALLVQGLAAKFPIILSVFIVMGVSRSILKPLFVFLNAAVASTPSLKDDELLKKVEGSSVYKSLVFALDYLFSIKLIK